ncbi:hypothetical protein LINPERHAP1_LOCUS35143 [Linum perenne]
MAVLRIALSGWVFGFCVKAWEPWGEEAVVATLFVHTLSL